MFTTRVKIPFYPFLVALLLSAVPGHSLSQSATIEGTVTDSGNNTPIGGATVAVSDPAFFRQTLATGTTDASGAYSVTVNMQVGETREFVVEAAGENHAPSRHGHSGTLPCFFNCGPGGEVSVTEGSTLTNINVTLDSGGRVSGTITEAATSNPIAGATASLISSELERYSFEFAGITQPNGNYTTGLAVSAGTYFLQASGGGANYVSQVWDGRTCQLGVCPIADTDPLTVAEGTIAGGFDFAFKPGATISGELLPDNINRTVLLFNAAGEVIGIEGIFDLPQTAWSFDSLAGGSYFVQLGPTISSSDGYLRVLHNGLLCPWGGCERARGTPLMVPPGTGLSLASITLSEGGQIEGTIVDGSTGLPPAGVPAEAQLGAYDIIDSAGNVFGGGLIRESAGSVVLEPTSAVPAGTYHVRTYNEWVADGIGHAAIGSDDAIVGYMDAVYPDVPCAGIDCDLDSAGTVVVTSGNTTTITIEINTGSSVSGRVVDEFTGTPIPDAVVRALDTSGETIARVLSDADGEYRFGALPAGSYFVRTSMSGDLGPGHGGVQNAYFDALHGASGQCSEALCDPAGATSIALDGINDLDLGNLQVAPGPVISGRIIDVATGLPVPRGQVRVYNDASEFVGSYKVNFATARFQTTALPPGAYTLVPEVSPAYGPVTISGNSTLLFKRQGLPANGSTVVMDKEDVEANLQIVDQALDRLFSDRFSQGQ